MSTTKTYRYALVYRPIGVGAVPSSGLIDSAPRPEKGQPHYGKARHGFAVYSRRLTAAEERQFELAYAIDSSRDMQEYADIVARCMGRYAGEYLQMQALDSRGFEELVMRTLYASSITLPSIGDQRLFLQLVAEGLVEIFETTKE